MDIAYLANEAEYVTELCDDTKVKINFAQPMQYGLWCHAPTLNGWKVVSTKKIRRIVVDNRIRVNNETEIPLPRMERSASF